MLVVLSPIVFFLAGTVNKPLTYRYPEKIVAAVMHARRTNRVYYKQFAYTFYHPNTYTNTLSRHTQHLQAKYKID